MKTAAVFTLNFMPQSFFLHRIRDADTIILLTDQPVDALNHVNRFVIRTASHTRQSITIPIEQGGIPTDEVRVKDRALWEAQMLRDLRRFYRGLLHADMAQEFVAGILSQASSPWLTDYLMTTFTSLLSIMGWSKKTVIRGCSQRRRRYAQESEYLLDLCIDADCDRLVVGGRQQAAMNQRMFRRNDIQIQCHKWDGTSKISSRDSILDVIARIPISEVMKEFQ